MGVADRSVARCRSRTISAFSVSIRPQPTPISSSRLSGRSLQSVADSVDLRADRTRSPRETLPLLRYRPMPSGITQAAAAEPWPPTSLREKPSRPARRSSPWSLRDLPNGRGRGVAADVGKSRRVDLPVVGATRAIMMSAGAGCDRRRQPRRAPAGRVCRRALQSAIMAHNHWEFGECRL
jgi:hypothetical protein